jgi:hypothetical protein
MRALAAHAAPHGPRAASTCQPPHDLRLQAPQASVHDGLRVLGLRQIAF